MDDFLKAIDALNENINSRFDILTDRVNDITQAMISTNKTVKLIKDDVEQLKSVVEDTEIEVTNGGGMAVKIKRDKIIAMSFEAVRPGGSIDVKFDEVREGINSQIDACKSEHSFFSRLGRFNAKGGSVREFVLIVGFFAMALLAIYSTFIKKTMTAQEIQQQIRTEVLKDLPHGK